jgi:hypothetical protein
MASNQFENSPDHALLQADSERTIVSQEVSASRPKTLRSPLGVDFQPSEYSVICGRGKASYDHAGNRRIRMLASMYVEKYSTTGGKKHKSTIASHIVAMTRDSGGNFCKYDKGAWFEVGDRFAHEKVGAMFRDMLPTQFQSSAKAKTARRRAQIKRKKAQTQEQYSQPLIDGTGHLDDSSVSSSSWSGTSSKDSLGFDYSLELVCFDIDVFSE